MHDPASMEFEHDPAPLRRRYALCRAAFIAAAVGLALLGLSSMISAIFLFTFDPDLHAVLRSPLWRWCVSAPVTWTTLLSAFLLWGRWTDPSWQRRAGILLLLNVLDLVSWTVQNGNELGLRMGPVGHAWLREYMSDAFGWIEFILFGSLAAEVARRPGSDAPDLLRNGVVALSTLGLLLCTATFGAATDWGHGWPLGPRPVAGLLDSYRLSNMILIMTTLQLVPLMMLGARQCARDLAAIQRAEEMPDLLVSRSEYGWREFEERPKD